MLTIRTNPYKLITDSMQETFEKALKDWYLLEAERNGIPDSDTLLREHRNVYYDELMAAVAYSVKETEGRNWGDEDFDNTIEEVYGDVEYLRDCMEDAYTFLVNNRYFHFHTTDSEDFSVWGRRYWEGYTCIEHTPLQEVW